MSKDNDKEAPSIVELYNTQYEKVIELTNNGKQKELNKAVDTLFKLFSLAVLIEQQEQQYEVLELEQEELDEWFDELEVDILNDINLEEKANIDQINTDAILDKSIEYYTNARNKLKEQISKDVFHIRNMTDEELKEYINSLFWFMVVKIDWLIVLMK